MFDFVYNELCGAAVSVLLLARQSRYWRVVSFLWSGSGRLLAEKN